MLYWIHSFVDILLFAIVCEGSVLIVSVFSCSFKTFCIFNVTFNIFIIWKPTLSNLIFNYFFIVLVLIIYNLIVFNMLFILLNSWNPTSSLTVNIVNTIKAFFFVIRLTWYVLIIINVECSIWWLLSIIFVNSVFVIILTARVWNDFERNLFFFSLGRVSIGGVSVL